MDYFKVFTGTLVLTASLLALFGKRRLPYLSHKYWAERVAAIEAGAPERYFEEYRALKAYPPKPSNRRIRIGLWVNVGLGMLIIVTGIVGMPAVLALLGWRR